MSLLHCLALLRCPWLTPWKTNRAIFENKEAGDSMAVSQGASASRPGCLMRCTSDQQVVQGTWCLPAS
eukprot:2652333-Ditylum_brightwellii.AAC.1